MPKHLFIICLFVFTLPYFCTAQQVETRINKSELLPSEVLKLTLKITSSRSPEPPEFPQIKGFRKGRTIWPPLTRGSRRVYSYSQIYYPTRKGNFKIPVIPIEVDGKQIYSQELAGEIVEDQAPAVNFVQDNFSCKLLLLTESTSPRVGQVTTLQLGLLLNKLDLHRISLPDFTYFQQELFAQIDKSLFDVEVAQNKASSSLPGVKHEINEEVLHLGTVFLIPRKAGILKLRPMNFKLRTRWENFHATPRDKDQEHHIRYYPRGFQTESLEFTVENLPRTQLPLAAIVGNFQLKDSLRKNTYLCGESIKYILKIYGEGNIRAIPRPLLKVPANFLQSDPVSSLEIIPAHSNLKGQKTFVYELIAAYPGEYVLPPVTYYFFNPILGSYDSTQLDSLYLNIIGEPIPQLLEINILHNFYRDALKDSQASPKLQIPYHPYILLGFSFFAFCLLVFSFLTSGKKIFSRSQSQHVLSPGVRKLMDYKKG